MKVLMCGFLMCLRETQAGTAGVNSRITKFLQRCGEYFRAKYEEAKK